MVLLFVYLVRMVSMWQKRYLRCLCWPCWSWRGTCQFSLLWICLLLISYFSLVVLRKFGYLIQCYFGVAPGLSWCHWTSNGFFHREEEACEWFILYFGAIWGVCSHVFFHLRNFIVDANLLEAITGWVCSSDQWECLTCKLLSKPWYLITFIGWVEAVQMTVIAMINWVLEICIATFEL